MASMTCADELPLPAELMLPRFIVADGGSENWRHGIPAKRQFPRVLGDILDAAASSAVTTGSVSYKPQAIKDQELMDYSISMSVGGSYAAVKSFLADLQKNSE